MWWLVITAGIAFLIYYYLIKPLGYWKERGVAHKKPWPILGNSAKFLFGKKSFTDSIKEFYTDFPNERFSGIYSFTRPQLVLRDPELIKQVTVKGFDHFVNRTAQFSQEIEPIFSKNLLSLEDQKWRDMRATLSPSFTSSKMKFMFNLISDCAEQFTKYFEKQGSNVISIEMKDVFSRLTNDVIATVAFGVTVDSLNEKTNEFYTVGKDVTNFEGLRALRFFAFSICPSLMKFFKIKVFPETFSDFFSRVIKETLEVREKQGVVRPDMIHLLLETRRGKLDKPELSDGGFAIGEDAKIENSQKVALTDEDITAQAMIFFFAGFETVSTLMSFMSHELAVNKDIQERLQEEVDKTLGKCNGKVTYEALLEMKYLDMVVSESLRKWVPALALDRVCDKDYHITPQSPNEKPFTIEKGQSLLIPVVGLHYDPKYFPNPEKFDPERFNETNKSKIVPYTYLPFGIGPRSCIASRFALMETKILFFHLLKQFDIVTTEKTPIPLVLSQKRIALGPDGGFWLGLQQRNLKKTL